MLTLRLTVAAKYADRHNVIVVTMNVIRIMGENISSTAATKLKNII